MAIAAGAVVMREPLVPPKSREVRAQYTAGDCALFIVYGTGNFGMLKWVRGIDSGNPYSKRDSEGRVTFGTSVPTTLKPLAFRPIGSVCWSHSGLRSRQH